MNYYGRRRYYRRYPYRTSRRAYATSSRSKRRAIGNQRAARQQKDISEVSLSITHKCSTSYLWKYFSAQTKFTTGVYALNIWDLLRKSDFYQSYASMYDQVKINSIKIRLTPISWNIGTLGTNYAATNTEYRAITVITAWDRTGLSAEQLKLIAQNVVNVDDDNPELVGILGTDANNDGIYVVNNEDIGTYSSALTHSLTFGSKSTINRYLYPSNLAEKSYYANTADLDKWYENYDFNKGRFYGIKLPDRVLGIRAFDDEVLSDQIIGEVAGSPAIDSNPCYIGEDSSVPFKPTLLIGVQSPVPTSTVQALQENTTIVNPVVFNIEADIGVSFRGLRKARMVE